MTEKKTSISIKASLNKQSLLSNKLLGREFSIFPAVMMKEGAYFPHVSGGEQVALFFEGKDLDKSVNSWNGRPVSLDHPVDSVSCNTPENYTKQWLGYVFNTRYDENEKALKSDIWVEKARGEFIVNKLSAGAQIDLSIGAFGEIICESGECNSVSYNHRFTGIIGDHLAVLPESSGACSWEDGCGIRAERKSDTSGDPELRCGKEDTVEKSWGDAAYSAVFSKKEKIAVVVPTEDKNLKEFSMDKITASESVEEVVVAKSCDQPKQPEAIKTPVVTMESYLAEAPSEIKATLVDAVNARNAQREDYVVKINACKCEDVKFCSQELAKASTETLKSIASLVNKVDNVQEKKAASTGVKAANYIMQGNAESKAVGYMAPATIDWTN